MVTLKRIAGGKGIVEEEEPSKKKSISSYFY